MVSFSTWLRYAATRFEYSVSLSGKSYNLGLIKRKELGNAIWKNFFQSRLTFCYWNKGEQMAPTLIGDGRAILVRKLLLPSSTQVFVGDVVVLKDPEKNSDYVVRRLAAIEGYEMVSTDEKDEPFILKKAQCWVLADNESLKPKEARDSRLFGPVPMTNIVGRVIYALRSAMDHGPVHNSPIATSHDSSVLAVELDIEEMVKSMKS